MKPIYISSDDHRLISRTIHSLIHGATKVPPAVRNLQQELNRATILNAVAISPKVVTLNSGVELRDLKSGETERWILTMPEHADPDQQRISVLAPVGTAILGFSEGDEIEWETPGGVRTLRIEKVEHGAFKIPDLTRSLFG